MKLNLDGGTTIAGGGVGLLILTQVDWTKFAEGDTGQIAIALIAVGMVALGYLTNKGQEGMK